MAESSSIPVPDTSSSKPTTNARSGSFVPVHTLVLDAGPILSLAPLRGMAKRFVAPPQVIAELKDEKARQYWERIQAGLIEGVEIEVKSPDAISLSKVIAFAQKTGDYAVLSKPDLAVLALTYAMDAEKKSSPSTLSEPVETAPPSKEEKADHTETEVQAGPSTKTVPTGFASAPKASPWGAVKKPVEVEASAQVDEEEGGEKDAFPSLPAALSERQAGDDEADRKAVEAHLAEMNITPSTRPITSDSPPITTEREKRIEELRLEMQEEEARKQQFEQVYADDEEDDDASDDGWDESGAGEWITPENVTKHKAVDLGLLPSTRTEAGKPTAAGSTPTEGTAGTLPEIKKKKKRAPRKPKTQVGVACFTGDYAVQNVLVQMGLGLVGEGGKRINSVKSWVLRCHACFKICKDPSKKFCPNCGGPTLIRASITTHAPTPANPTPRIEVHLKQNFQYRTRGTVYSIPAPKMGSSKSASNGGGGLILREDQKEFQRGLKREEGRRWKEDKELERAVKAQMEGKGAGLGSWNDPDWLPEILTTGSSGKGRRTGGEGLPTVGYGKKNPNEARRRKK